jgi:hypothetical protein
VDFAQYRAGAAVSQRTVDLGRFGRIAQNVRLKTMPMSPQLTDAAAAAVAAVTAAPAAAAALSGTKRHCCVGTRARESARAHSVQYYEGTMGECSADYGTGTAVQAREEHEDRQLPQVVRNAQPTEPDQPCHSTGSRSAT